MTMKLSAALLALAPCWSQSFLTTPLNDLSTGTYQGFQGGLYENGTNVIPSDHAQIGVAAGQRIVPLNKSGSPSSRGKILVVVMGMSNADQIGCRGGQPADPSPCDPASLIGQVTAHAGSLNKAVEIVNCGIGGMSIEEWVGYPGSTNPWPTCLSRVSAAGSVAQVQAVIAYDAHQVHNTTFWPTPPATLPDPNADAFLLERDLGTWMRQITSNFPDTQEVFLESLSYEGYGCNGDPEPYAFENGFSYKWLIASQISQERGGQPDAWAGDLSAVPWLSWGYYWWASDGNVRSDGLTWLLSDTYGGAGNNCHASEQGVTKLVSGVGGATGLFNYLLTSPQTPWF